MNPLMGDYGFVVIYMPLAMVTTGCVMTTTGNKLNECGHELNTDVELVAGDVNGTN